jgi:DNA-binding transcriptional MerR regulator
MFFVTFVCNKRLKLIEMTHEYSYKPLTTNELMPYIQDKVYKASEIGVPARTIHHWKNEGILFESSSETEKNKMLKFSLAEYFWIKTIMKCRDYGLQLKDIKKIKEDITKIVHSYDDTRAIENVLLKDVRSSLKGKSKEKVDAEIEGARKYIHHVQITNRNVFEEVLFAVLYNKVHSGLLIFKNGNDIQTEIYIHNPNEIGRFYQAHLYISFDSIFCELGLTNHFKQPQLLSKNEKRSIHILKTLLQSDKAKKIIVEKKNNSVHKIGTALKEPANRKEVEEYKRRLGKNLKYQTTIYDGEMNLFDFHYIINMPKE